jgi:hypothetical protein
MSNIVSQAILEYRYKTNAYIALLNENNYFDMSLSNACSRDILGRVVNQYNMICEGLVPYPKNSVKRMLSEQGGELAKVFEFGKGIDEIMAAYKAAEAVKAAEAARVASEVTKVGAEAVKSNTAIIHSPKPILEVPPGTLTSEITPRSQQLMNRARQAYLEFAINGGYKGAELDEKVSEFLKGMGLHSSFSPEELNRINEGQFTIRKAAEEAAEYLKQGKQIPETSLAPFKFAAEKPSSSGKYSLEDMQNASEHFSTQMEKTKQAKRAADAESNAQPFVDWQAHGAIPSEKAEEIAKAAEETASEKAAKGQKESEKQSNIWSSFFDKQLRLQSEIETRKAREAIFSPEDEQSFSDLVDRLSAHNQEFERRNALEKGQIEAGKDYEQKRTQSQELQGLRAQREAESQAKEEKTAKELADKKAELAREAEERRKKSTSSPKESSTPTQTPQSSGGEVESKVSKISGETNTKEEKPVNPSDSATEQEVFSPELHDKMIAIYDAYRNGTPEFRQQLFKSGGEGPQAEEHFKKILEYGNNYYLNKAREAK